MFEVWAVSEIICLGSLAGLSVTDIHYRKVSGELLAMGAVGAFIYQVCFRQEDLWIVGGGIAVGLFFLFMSRITGEGLGYGDSIAILILGLYMGIWKLLWVLSGAFALLTVGAVVGLGRKKMSRKYTLPFFPFLTAGYLLYLFGRTLQQAR